MGARIRAAAAAELLAGGVTQFSFTRVARRAGVAKGTVSLRYPEPLDLMVDSVASLLVWEPVPQLGDLTEELRLLADRLIAAAFRPPIFGLSQSVLAVATERPETWKHYVERINGPGLAMARGVFERAQGRGEVHEGTDLDALVRAFIGGLQMTIESDPQMAPPSVAARDALVDVVIAACRGGGAARQETGRRTRSEDEPGRSPKSRARRPTPG